jgi:hypothetical protein
MMKLFLSSYILCTCLTGSYIFGWATPEQNVGHVARPRVNFSGSIKVHQGNKWDHIENITIDGKYTQIQMRVVPETLPAKIVNEQTGKDEIILKEDPNGRRGYTAIKIDLAEIKSIQSVPNLTYVYKNQVGNTSHVTTFFELIVTPKDSSLKPYHCLVLETVRVKWDEKSSAGPVNMETPIGAIALLEIAAMQADEPAQPLVAAVKPLVSGVSVDKMR